ncbi:hypothetical protein [Nocardia cyriacigeorgica]|uniref:hypothetical protein n=1 Tax=Nocardia cyriacigeorgica TaxID=135487 RepID=UPI001E2B0661|nr:hypothetical protein [Nocardia cyriacigeorgica]
MAMGQDHRSAREQPTREQLELELVRDVVLARRRQESLVLAALTFGAELLDVGRRSAASRAGRILESYAVDENDIARDPRAALRADMARERARARRIGLGTGQNGSEEQRRRTHQIELLYEVRADLLDVVRSSRKYRFDRDTFSDQIAQGLCAVTDKLIGSADMDTYHAWQRGMVLKLIEEPTRYGPPRVLATVDAGPGRKPLTVEWDSCERRLALVMRMMRAGVSPVVICERLLADLSRSSPLRYSER